MSCQSLKKQLKVQLKVLPPGKQKLRGDGIGQWIINSLYKHLRVNCILKF